MRTILMIDDDVLTAARVRARAEKRSVGAVISDMARRALKPDVSNVRREDFPVLPLRKDAKPVTLEIVNTLREELD
jgi:hypothetical protein